MTEYTLAPNEEAVVVENMVLIIDKESLRDRIVIMKGVEYSGSFTCTGGNTCYSYGCIADLRGGPGVATCSAACSSGCTPEGSNCGFHSSS